MAYLLKARNFQPLGLEYLSSALKARGHETMLADATFPKAVERAIRKFQPAAVGYYTPTGLHKELIALNRRLKSRYDFISIFGGPHPTFFPEMIEHDGVDAVCRGEAEGAVVEFADAVDAGLDYAHIKNFWVKTVAGIVRNPMRPLLSDLDLLPAPDWGLSLSIPHCKSFPVRIFMASRGCPFDCAFCYNPTFRKIYEGQKTFRIMSPEKIVAEIAACARITDMKFVYLFDDTFGVDEQWVEKFARYYGSEVGLPFYVNLRADIATEDKVRMLKEAGLAYAGVGVESGSETIRFDMLNKRIPDADIKRCARWLKRYGVAFTTFNIIGLPATSIADDMRALEFNSSIGPAFAEACMFQPYPRTPLGEKVIRLGEFDGNPDSIPKNFKGKTPLKIDDAKKRERLVYLFPFLVRRKAGVKLARFLLSLPLTPLYRLFSRIYEGYVKVFSIYRVSMPLSSLVRIAWHYLRY